MISKKVKVIWNKRKQWASHLSKEIKSFLKSKGFSIVKGNANATIVIGGDGTIFYHKSEISGRLVGIGSESSYICQLNRDTWQDSIVDILKSNESISLSTIDVFLINRNRKRKVDYALNDVVIHSSNFSTVQILYLTNLNVGYFEGDGLIVSTPLGSTGYNLSVGGPVVELDVNAFIVSPIAPVKSLVKPRIVNDNIDIRITFKGDATLIIDGQKRKKLPRDAIVLLSKSNKSIDYALW